MSSVKAIALAVVAAMVGAVALAHGEPANRADKVSNSDYARTVQQVETALKGKGMMIVATIDHQNMMRMVGAPAALGVRARVESRCHTCAAPVTLALVGGVVTEASAGTVIWAAERDLTRSLHRYT